MSQDAPPLEALATFKRAQLHVRRSARKQREQQASGQESGQGRASPSVGIDTIVALAASEYTCLLKIPTKC